MLNHVMNACGKLASVIEIHPLRNEISSSSSRSQFAPLRLHCGHAGYRRLYDLRLRGDIPTSVQIWQQHQVFCGRPGVRRHRSPGFRPAERSHNRTVTPSGAPLGQDILQWRQSCCRNDCLIVIGDVVPAGNVHELLHCRLQPDRRHACGKLLAF